MALSLVWGSFMALSLVWGSFMALSLVWRFFTTTFPQISFDQGPKSRQTLEMLDFTIRILAVHTNLFLFRFVYLTNR